ncbi:helix-turn-helix domain-containing protein [Mesorhizobium sp. BH1-1-5]|uniref:helix-turn-helix domain-containing protein n=1 Tax=Mesorhizobium sp. BH1-1-5 TaxID=2876661 RepID=UPI001CCE769A|nr:helix-turn-helix domain-containing protein [Mesorhizobium sp. BH1-1-5]MBZ9985714.1 helix-turn-helix domain-containing protein [Mesorhizobium sp. BH1-1-5]
MNQHFYRKGEDLCKEPLHYTMSGLDNIYLKNGFEWEWEDGEKYLSVKDMDGLHRAIGLHIVLARKAPTGKELRFLRNELNMSQADLAKVLSVSDQSVARWEKGHCEANGGAVFALRTIYLLSLVPVEERAALLDGLVERLKRLADADETSDSIVLQFKDNKWRDPALLAA